ncbi:unnamed protein product [Penicillium salamii]|uniref:Aminoglycoside phosphotransferase domain-containing protein n=1 Tax=Penicillium salamii TaxID=1612424 RepID=A0A9W4IUF3_9EURO|nr:unnamed protein product [Penicillium salamii]
MLPRMPYDDASWEKSEEVADSWVRQFLEPDILRQIGGFLVRHHSPSDPDQFSILEKGAFNISLRMKYENVSSAVIRFPQPGATMFPEENVRNEVAIMRFIHAKTSIPVPFVLHWGTRKESPLQLNPFIIMEYIDHDTNMYDALNSPECSKSDRGALDSSIDEDKLEFLYGELANILLQLSAFSLPQIGSLDQVDDFTWEVAYRPLSMPMNELIRLGSLSQLELPHTTFDTASSYLEHLARLHISHLVNQRNDAIDSANDCRRKFVARKLFPKLAQDHRLFANSSQFEHGPFKLWCDDYRPANVLLDKSLSIFGVVEWEFTYAVPGLRTGAWSMSDDFRQILRALTQHEDKMIEQGHLKEYQRLSKPIRDSWKSGDFWIAYAARNNFAFDAIYWEKIDRRFFGTVDCSIDDLWEHRLDLLNDKEKAEMESLVAQKPRDMETRILAWDPDDYTLARLNVREEIVIAKEDLGLSGKFQ